MEVWRPDCGVWGGEAGLISGISVAHIGVIVGIVRGFGRGGSV